MEKLKRRFWGYKVKAVKEHLEYLETEYDKKTKHKSNQVVEINKKNNKLRREIEIMKIQMEELNKKELDFYNTLHQGLLNLESTLGQAEIQAELEKQSILNEVELKNQELQKWQKKLDEIHSYLSGLVKSLDDISMAKDQIVVSQEEDGYYV